MGKSVSIHQSQCGLRKGYTYLDHLNKGYVERQVRQVVEDQATRKHEADGHNDAKELFGTRAELFSRVD